MAPYHYPVVQMLLSLRAEKTDKYPPDTHGYKTSYPRYSLDCFWEAGLSCNGPA